MDTLNQSFLNLKKMRNQLGCAFLLILASACEDSANDSSPSDRNKHLYEYTTIYDNGELAGKRTKAYDDSGNWRYTYYDENADGSIDSYSKIEIDNETGNMTIFSDNDNDGVIDETEIRNTYGCPIYREREDLLYKAKYLNIMPSNELKCIETFISEDRENNGEIDYLYTAKFDDSNNYLKETFLYTNEKENQIYDYKHVYEEGLLTKTTITCDGDYCLNYLVDIIYTYADGSLEAETRHQYSDGRGYRHSKTTYNSDGKRLFYTYTDSSRPSRSYKKHY